MNLNPDELFRIAVLMDLPDLLSLCKTSKYVNEKLCKKDNIWLYKLNQEYPNFREFRESRTKNKNKSYKDLYIDMVKNSLPKKFDRKRKYRLLDLYKSVENGYNTRDEFKNFVQKIDIENLIVNNLANIDNLYNLYPDQEETTLFDFVSIVEDELGSYEPLNSGRVVIYFSYPQKKVTYGPSREYYNPDNLGLWAK